jgi:hypothetical protein
MCNLSGDRSLDHPRLASDYARMRAPHGRWLGASAWMTPGNVVSLKMQVSRRRSRWHLSSGLKKKYYYSKFQLDGISSISRRTYELANEPNDLSTSPDQ